MNEEEKNSLNGNPPVSRHNRSLIAVIILLLLVIVWLLVKPPVPLPPGPPPGPPAPGVHVKEGPEKLRTVSGIVMNYKYNPHLDVNALQLNTINAGTIIIDFRPHTAKAVMGIGSLGQSVTVDYSMHPDDEAVGYQLKRIENNATGKSLVLENLPPPPDVPDHAAQNFKVNNPQLITDQYGGIVALRKESLLFHFKPGLVDDIAPLIKESHSFGLMAVRRDDNLGFVNIHHDRVYIVISITLDNKTFLVR